MFDPYIIVSPKIANYERLEEISQKLKEIACENNIAIVMPTSHDEFIDHCLKSEHFFPIICDRLYDLCGSEGRGRSRDVPGSECNSQQEHRKENVSSCCVQAEKAIQLLECDNEITVHIIKERSRPEGVEPMFHIGSGSFERTIQDIL